MSMSFLNHRVGSIWGVAAPYLPAPAKYCQDNNISWTTTGNLAKELAFISLWGPLAAVRESGEAAAAAVMGSGAVAAGAKALGLGRCVFEGVCKMLSAKAVEFAVDVNTTVDKLEDMLERAGFFGPADGQVKMPGIFRDDAGGDVLPDDRLPYSFADYSDGTQEFAAPGQDFPPSPDTFAFACPLLESPAVELTGNCAALPLA
jgi:hypothetical protein